MGWALGNGGAAGQGWSLDLMVWISVGGANALFNAWAVGSGMKVLLNPDY